MIPLLTLEKEIYYTLRRFSSSLGNQLKIDNMALTTE